MTDTPDQPASIPPRRKPIPFRHIPMSIPQLDAETEWQSYCDETKSKGVPATKKAFMAGLTSTLKARTSRREKWESERFRRAFTLAHQLYTIITQCLVLLNNLRKSIGIVDAEGRPVDPLNIGKTIETVVVAMKHAQTALKILDEITFEKDGDNAPSSGN